MLIQLLLNSGQLLSHGVGNMHLIQNLVQVVGLAASAAHHAGGDAHGGGVFRHFFQHHGVGGDLGVVLDLEGAQHLGTRAYKHVVAEGGMTLAHVLARTAQGHALIQSAVVPDLGGLADDYPHTVVDEQPLADGVTGVDLNARLMPRPLADGAGGEVMLRQVELVGHAVGQDGVDTRVQKQDLQITAGGGVALAHRLDIGGDLLADGGYGVGHLPHRLFEDAGEVEVDDIIGITVHGRYLFGVEWGTEDQRSMLAATADLLGEQTDEALQGGGEDEVDGQLQQVVDTGAENEDEVHGGVAGACQVGVDGVHDDEAPQHEQTRVDGRHQRGGDEYGQQGVLLGQGAIDPTGDKACGGGLDDADQGGHDRGVIEQEAREGIHVHNTQGKEYGRAVDEAQNRAGGRAEEHSAQSNGDQNQTDFGAEGGNGNAREVEGHDHGGEQGQLDEVQDATLLLSAAIPQGGGTVISTDLLIVVHLFFSFEDFHLMLPSAVGTARKNL